MKLGVCIPFYKQVPSQAVTSIMALQRYLHLSEKFAGHFDDFEVITVDSCFVDMARNMLVDEAVKNECDYILWIDSDHLFIPTQVEDFVKRAIESKYDIVGAWYNNRTVQYQPVAYNFSDDKEIPIMLNLIQDKVKNHKGYYECDCIGLGMAIMPINILKEMKDKYHFVFRCKDYDGRIIGEDTFFFFNIKNNNTYKVSLDTTFKVGHIGGVI
jgi:hypothetical protein